MDNTSCIVPIDILKDGISDAGENFTLNLVNVMDSQNFLFFTGAASIATLEVVVEEIPPGSTGMSHLLICLKVSSRCRSIAMTACIIIIMHTAIQGHHNTCVSICYTIHIHACTSIHMYLDLKAKNDIQITIYRWPYK